jgi:hypothetical protein
MLSPVMEAASVNKPPGLFVGERVFMLTPKPNGIVEFSMRKMVTGPRAPLIGRSPPP